MRHAYWLVSLLALTACGGKVVYKTGGSDDGGGGSDGDGGSEPQAECFVGCGQTCTKCEGTDCFTGVCSDEGQCVPAGAQVFCPDG
jgi:hypothetical protein